MRGVGKAVLEQSSSKEPKNPGNKAVIIFGKFKLHNS
jgi:hypothetical protein